MKKIEIPEMRQSTSKKNWITGYGQSQIITYCRLHNRMVWKLLFGTANNEGYVNIHRESIFIVNQCTLFLKSQSSMYYLSWLQHRKTISIGKKSYNNMKLTIFCMEEEHRLCYIVAKRICEKRNG